MKRCFRRIPRTDRYSGNYSNAFYVGSAICAVAPESLFLAKRPAAPVSSYIEKDERKPA
jgi:hypothetical protein